MRRDVLKLLVDIRDACEFIREFASGRTLEEYRTNAMLRSAVERQFEICGEALNQLLKTDASLAASFTEPVQIIAFRHRLIHGYASISEQLVWDVVRDNMPILLNEVRALLEAAEGSG